MMRFACTDRCRVRGTKADTCNTLYKLVKYATPFRLHGSLQGVQTQSRKGNVRSMPLCSEGRALFVAPQRCFGSPLTILGLGVTVAVAALLAAAAAAAAAGAGVGIGAGVGVGVVVIVDVVGVDGVVVVVVVSVAASRRRSLARRQFSEVKPMLSPSSCSIRQESWTSHWTMLGFCLWQKPQEGDPDPTRLHWHWGPLP